MGMGVRVTMLFVLIWWSRVEAQTPAAPKITPRALDAILQDFAYRAFASLGPRTRTGRLYDAAPPSNLSGIQISAMRLRSGSLFTRGVSMYKQFKIPIGVIEKPYVERLVLVYQNLGNWSTVYYPLPGYVYLAPILALLAYDASNLSARNLQNLDLHASQQPISIEFTDLKPVPGGSVPRCVWFDINGQINYTNVVSGNKCVTFDQGHFSIVVPQPQPHHGGGNKSRGWIIAGSVIGGVALLVLLALLILCAWRFNKRKKMHQMEKAADAGEVLQMTTVGSMKAPAATTTRTQPTLETEYVP